MYCIKPHLKLTAVSGANTIDATNNTSATAVTGKGWPIHCSKHSCGIASGVAHIARDRFRPKRRLNCVSP